MAFRVGGQVYDPAEEMAVALGQADVDDRGAGKVLLKHRQHLLARIAAERIERLVDDHPARLVQGKPGKCQQPLLLVIEFAIPARNAVERGGEPPEPDPGQRSRQIGIGEIGRFERIAEHVPAATPAGNRACAG